jgi:hypothetical protein
LRRERLSAPALNNGVHNNGGAVFVGRCSGRQRAAHAPHHHAHDAGELQVVCRRAADRALPQGERGPQDASGGRAAPTPPVAGGVPACGVVGCAARGLCPRGPVRCASLLPCGRRRWPCRMQGWHACDATRASERDPRATQCACALRGARRARSSHAAPGSSSGASHGGLRNRARPFLAEVLLGRRTKRQRQVQRH